RSRVVAPQEESAHAGQHYQSQAEHYQPGRPARPTRVARVSRAARPFRLGRETHQLVEAGGRGRAGRPVGPVILLDQWHRGGADDLRDAADVPPGVEVAAALGVVVGFDVADDARPDPGPLADLQNAETGLLTGIRQGLADAHPTPP